LISNATETKPRKVSAVLNFITILLEFEINRPVIGLISMRNVAERTFGVFIYYLLG
jgi:hypothetical protein